MIKAEWTNKDALDFCNEFATDCISRQAAIDALCNRCDLVHDVPCTEECNDIKILRKLPSTDRTGHWIQKDYYDTDWNVYECDQCGEPWQLECGTPKDNNMNYCPRCGADMRGGAIDE